MALKRVIVSAADDTDKEHSLWIVPNVLDNS